MCYILLQKAYYVLKLARGRVVRHRDQDPEAYGQKSVQKILSAPRTCAAVGGDGD